jgi:hypothetical protein
MQKKPWTKMTADELAEATAEFDAGPGPRTIKPSRAGLAKHRRAIAKPNASRSKALGRGRPRLGDGAARVLFTIERGLLLRLDAFARKHNLNRSRLISLSVESYMNHMRSGAETKSPPPAALAG